MSPPTLVSNGKKGEGDLSFQHSISLGNPGQNNWKPEVYRKVSKETAKLDLH